VSITNAIASLAVRNLPSSIEWYARLLGRLPDSRPMQEVAEWKFERGGWLQLFQEDARAGSGTVTLTVSDLGQLLSQLRQQGDAPGEPVVSEKVRVVMVKDPDGNSIAFAEPLDPTMAQ
jgi:catechol 2,3-dioxygenase-like lactoylglutathione lyase family enzyme